MNYHNLRDLKVRSTEDGDNFNVPTYTPTQIFHVPKGRQRWFATVIGSVSATFLVLFTLILVYICLMRVKRSIRQTAELESSLQSLPDESLATAQAQSQLNDSGIRKLSILELEQATSNFSPNNIIGEGPFGSVYKGLLPDGAIAAIKRRLYLLLPNFIDEAERIGRIQHKHLVKLIGYSQSNYQQLLVYDFISNGSVGRHLYDTEGLPTGKLSIRRRLSIALGAAKGLAHLHSIVPTVLHLHFRTSNVLVDENYTPKVSDSGLSNLLNILLVNTTVWAEYARNRFGNRSTSSAIWRAISPLITLLRRDSFWELSNGNTCVTHLCEWFDVILPQEAHDWRVRDVISDPLIRNRLLDLLPDGLNETVSNISLGIGPDKLIWKGSSSGVFSVRQYYLKHRIASPKQRLFANIWQLWIPPKLSGLVWKIFHKAVPTDDNVGRLGFHLPSKCQCCQSGSCETMDHLFCQSEIAVKGWSFLANLFHKQIPRNINQLKYYWILPVNIKSFFDCLSLALAVCLIWQLWNYRNKAIHNEARPDIIKQIKQFACLISPKIKAVYSPCRISQLSLDILHVVAPGPGLMGAWKRWHPGEVGLTVSLAINIQQCGFIVRDHKGTLKLAGSFSIVCEDLFEGIILVMGMLKDQFSNVYHLHSSHTDMDLLQSDTFKGPWDRYKCWKDTSNVLQGMNISKIDMECNGPAIALSFSREVDNNYTCFNDLPVSVRRALMGDFLKLPNWSRLSSSVYPEMEFDTQQRHLYDAARLAHLQSTGIICV